MISNEPPAILLVEDEHIVAMDLQNSLSDLGYDVYAIASSADEALDEVAQRRPDLVLMDIRIKGDVDGIATAALLRERFCIPVVYLTAYADDTTLERAKATEAYGYVLKPVRAAELRSVVEIALHKHAVDRQLSERERWFSTTLKSIADAVITVDLEGNVSFMNPVAEELTGMNAEYAIGRPAREVVRLLDPTAQASPLEQALSARRAVWIQEAALESRRGPARVISDSAAPVIDDGRMLGAVMVFRDITEQKLLQQRLELSERLASLGTMAAGVAHEVNNPLAVIVANASFAQSDLERLVSELELDSRLDDGMRERARELSTMQREIEAAASRIGRIVADLKEFSRPDTKTLGRADVGRSVEWAIRTTAHEFRHRARVVTELQDLPPVALEEIKLGQVLVNLLINAAHALPLDHVEDNLVSLAAWETPDQRVVIEVRDTGSGMPPEVLERVFDPFFTTKPVGVGTGLGLSICHGIAASAGGDLQAESRTGAGSVFRLELPLATSSSTRVPAPPDRRARAHETWPSARNR